MRTRAQGSGLSHPEEILEALDEPREGNKKPARPDMLAKEDGDILCGTISAVSGMLVGGKGKHEAWNWHCLYGSPAVPEISRPAADRFDQFSSYTLHRM